MSTKNDTYLTNTSIISRKKTPKRIANNQGLDQNSNLNMSDTNTVTFSQNFEALRNSHSTITQKQSNLKSLNNLSSMNTITSECFNTSSFNEEKSLVDTFNDNDRISIKNWVNAANKRLSIETNEEAESKYNFKNVNTLSATNNSSASMYGLTKNSLTSGAKGGLTTKNTHKGFDLKKPPHMMTSNANYDPKISPGRKLKIVNTSCIGQPISSNGIQIANWNSSKSNNFQSSNHSVPSPMGNNSDSYINTTHTTVNDSRIQNQIALQQKQTSTPSQKRTPIPNHEPTKCSVKRNGIVKAYAANTNQGIVRNYNEDRVSIILNIMKPANRASENWPKCSFFGIYDGHGGALCADFLRDNLHQYVIKESSFPSNPKEAIIKGFEEAERKFIELAENTSTGELDRSGSCAVVVLIVGDMCYVANVGDSRAVMSGDSGNKIFPLTRDHKPMDDIEQKRIIEAGGKIYQSQAPVIKNEVSGKPQMQFLLGPHRVFPGRLSIHNPINLYQVSRTFGDIEAKLPKYGGNPNVVVPIPDIKSFKIADEFDFIVLASDGIYDKLSNKEVINAAWESTDMDIAPNIHQQCGLAVEHILREAINRRTLDNITVVIIGFENFKESLYFRQQKIDINELDITNVGSRKGLPPTAKNSSKSKPSPSKNLSNKENYAKEESIHPQVKPFNYFDNPNKRILSKNKRIEHDDNQKSWILKSNDSKEEIHRENNNNALNEFNQNNIKNQFRNISISHINNNDTKQNSELRSNSLNQKPNTLDKFDIRLLDCLLKLTKQLRKSTLLK